MVSQVYYLNSDKFPAIANDYSEAQTRAEKLTSQKTTDKKDNSAFTALLEPIPFARRTLSIPDKLSQGQVSTALGMAGLALINFPEDCRDIRSAAKQVKSWFTGEKFEAAYDYAKHQHPFSFFRGTSLKGVANPNTSSNPELAERLFKSDKTLAEMPICKKILEFLGVEKTDKIATKIEAINSTKENPRFVQANVYEGKAFGKLTAKFMERSTIWGLGAMSLLELPQIASAFCKGDNLYDKAESGAKQIVKSGINVAAVTAGIGYVGAIGAKLGPVGSLVGMGMGAVLGGYSSNQLQKIVS